MVSYVFCSAQVGQVFLCRPATWAAPQTLCREISLRRRWPSHRRWRSARTPSTAAQCSSLRTHRAAPRPASRRAPAQTHPRSAPWSRPKNQTSQQKTCGGFLLRAFSNVNTSVGHWLSLEDEWFCTGKDVCLWRIQVDVPSLASCPAHWLFLAQNKQCYFFLERSVQTDPSDDAFLWGVCLGLSKTVFLICNSVTSAWLFVYFVCQVSNTILKLK